MNPLSLRLFLFLVFLFTLRYASGLPGKGEETVWKACAVLLFLLALGIGLWRRRAHPDRRGMEGISHARARSQARQSAGKGQTMPGIYFGGLLLPAGAATSHFMLVGTTGSGKTLQIRMMMGSTLPEILRQRDQRAILFDVKQDQYSVLRGLGLPEEQILLLNPFDRRCHAWDLAADVTGPDTAIQLAAILVPEEEGSNNRYFSDAARDLLTGVINLFQETAPGKWEFRDLVVATRNPLLLQHVLAQSEEGRDLAALHLEAGNTSRSVVSTLRSKLAPFQVIAALWRHAALQGRRISLRAFLQENRVLVLGNNQAALTPIQAINRVLFQRLTELVLDQPESETRRTWFFLDEVRKLGKLHGLDDLMTNGRSKGACVLLGFQDIDGMRDVYGKEVAGELTAMCGSFGVLKVSGVSTPPWASELFGDQEVRQRTRSVAEGQTTGQNFSTSSTDTHSEVIRERKLFLSAQFRVVPRPEPGKPLCGYFSSAFIENSRPYYAQISPREVNTLLLPKAKGAPDFLPWPDESYKRLQAWEEGDFRRLGLPPPTGSTGDSAGSGAGGVSPDLAGPSRSGFVDPFASP